MEKGGDKVSLVMKMLGGILLFIIPIGLYIYEYTIGTIYPGIELLRSLRTVLLGIIPILCAIAGFFLMYLSYEELKIEKEFREEGPVKIEEPTEEEPEPEPEEPEPTEEEPETEELVESSQPGM